MITAIRPKWRRVQALWLMYDDFGKPLVPTEWPASRLANMAIIHRKCKDGRPFPYPWIIVHQPSGKVLCGTKTRRIARGLVESLAERFDLSAIDRSVADETEQPGDPETLRAIRDFVRATPGVS